VEIDSYLLVNIDGGLSLDLPELIRDIIKILLQESDLNGEMIAFSSTTKLNKLKEYF
jgi:hypothetical protein